MASDRLTAIDLFCGAGGLSTGLQWAGFDIIWSTDSDEAATETYRENHPGVECVTADITEIGLPEFETSPDLVVGAPPCPPFSVVGRSKLNSLEDRDVTSDSRTQLWKQLRDAVELYCPRTFLMENVPGMASATNEIGESVLQHICDQFRALDYEVRPQVVDAADYGVPQRRERLLILGTRGVGRPPDLDEWRTHREPRPDEKGAPRLVSRTSDSQPQQTLDDYGAEASGADDEERPRTRVPWITVAEAISDLPPLSPAGSRAADSHPPAAADRYELPPVTRYQEWAREEVPTTSDGDGEAPRLHNHEARYHNRMDLAIYSLLGLGTGWTIGELQDELQPYRTDVFSDNYTRQRPDRPSSTIPAHIHKDGHMHIHPGEARSFTVREAARIQSFPDRFVFPVSRTAAYRQVGNAVPPLLAEAVGRALRATLKDS